MSEQEFYNEFVNELIISAISKLSLNEFSEMVLLLLP